MSGATHATKGGGISVSLVAMRDGERKSFESRGVRVTVRWDQREAVDDFGNVDRDRFVGEFTVWWSGYPGWSQEYRVGPDTGNRPKAWRARQIETEMMTRFLAARVTV